MYKFIYIFWSVQNYLEFSFALPNLQDTILEYSSSLLIKSFQMEFLRNKVF